MKAKKWIALCIAGMMVISMMACGKKPDDKIVSSEMEQDTNVQEDAVKENDNEADDAAQADETVQDDSGKKNQHGDMIHLMVGNVYEHEYSDTYGQSIAHAEYPVIELEECCEEKYEALEDAIDDLNEDERATVRNQYWDLIDSANEMLRQGDMYFAMYEITEDVTVRRADNTVVSLLYDGYTYTGGVHGLNYYWSRNIDVQTGKTLLLSDVLNDVEGFPGMVRREVQKQIPEDELFGYDGIEDAVSYAGENLTWILDYHGLTVCFDPYEIGPFASGAHMVTLSFAEYPNLVKEQYTKAPADYTIYFSEYLPCYYDVDADGVLDKIEVSGRYDEYDTITSIVTSINGRRYEYETWCYVLKPVLVHKGDGSNYLYIQTTSDNDYRSIDIYRITPDKLESLGYINCGFHSVYVEDEEYWGLEQVLTDPYQFRLDVRSDMLSTVGAYKNYIINENGVPASKDLYYYMSSPLRLTSKMPLPVELVDKDTNETVGYTTVEKGDVVTYYGTDNKDIAYLKLSDGSIAKVIVNMESWPRLVNGIPLEEQFDGTVFAG